MKFTSLWLTMLFAALLVTACSDDDSDSPNNTTTEGRLAIRMTDAPAVYDEINVTFSEIQVHHNDAWVSMGLSAPVTINLLEWNNGKSILLVEKDIGPGKVTQIRLMVDDANIVVAGIQHPMDIPSGAQTGLKINTNFDIEAGNAYVLVLDFDAQKSVVVMGPPTNPNGYKLQPVIRAVPLEATGSISGVASPSTDMPMARAMNSGGAEVTTSIADPATGAFTLGFLTAGDYTVIVEDTAGRVYTQSNVTVTVGNDTDIGTVTLQ